MNELEINQRRVQELTKGDFLYLTGYTVQRIVYELIKNYMMQNSPAECGITLAQRYDPDITKSTIFLDIAYNWKSQAIDKLPAIFVQRGDIEIKSPTIGQAININAKESEDTRLIINTMPVKITCIAASPVAVVENLAEYVKQPLLYFRKEIKDDFSFRGFTFNKITTPAIVQEGKTNFFVDLLLTTTFDENWIIRKDDLKMKSCRFIFDEIITKQKECLACNDKF